MRLQVHQKYAQLRDLKNQEPAIVEELQPLQKSLETKQGWLEVLRDRLNGNHALPMHLIHIDPNGFNVTRGLLYFAWTKDAPQLFASGDGMVRMYFRGSEDQFFSATWGSEAARNAIKTYLPELSASLTQEVVLALADYFQVEGID